METIHSGETDKPGWEALPIPDKKVLNFAKENIPSTGILCQSKAYVYLKIHDDFIHKLFPLLDFKEKQMPPYFSAAYNNVGAHISVIYTDEFQEIFTLKEVGMRVDFEILDLYKMKVKTAFKNFSAFIVWVRSQPLEHLRLQYGFPQKPVYHGVGVDFHITIAN
jgi:hypothetical protein